MDGSIARIKNFAKVYDLTAYERVEHPALSFTLLLVCHHKLSQTVITLGYQLGSTIALEALKAVDRPQVKRILEDELPRFPYSDVWSQKFQNLSSPCSTSSHVICPDGILFKRRQR